ncbi:CaiB/BaiF CoA transferase family protein [Rhodococcus sp. T7]|uniref:CaiB/BaiF CoA transferase family protein n=1 Tax=Rhodococcus sp. T7 TaxID=627444 RepID=UPI00135A8D14|nr:CoA transferase [Rhodococcus sp. T7]KAF0957189.1 Acetyl-CoA:oxalate CoA-transferase [Rhodococcus sp. T7]KAF0959027.1 Acetyl-CoA:oxalate CoA-transferase [Rhodococcus sp. T7]
MTAPEIVWADNVGPLQGMRVLDLSQQLPGPYATLLLASLGASVIKIEPPHGDAARHLDPEMFANANAGKSSITVDLKTAHGREVVHAAARSAHAVIEGFRPGVVDRLRVDYATLREINPGLIYCSISAYGQSGPLSSHPAHDISLQAIAGAISSETAQDRIGVPWVDLATGTTAALAMTASWHAGSGGYLDMCMLDAAQAWATIKPSAVLAAEPTYGTVPTADGAVVIALLEDAMWKRLCVALEWRDWADDPRLETYRQRQAAAHEVRARLDKALAELRTEDVLELAETHDLPIHRIGRDAASDAQVRLRLDAQDGHRHESVPLPASWQSPLSGAPELH